jgi:hypothetical protein
MSSSSLESALAFATSEALLIFRTSRASERNRNRKRQKSKEDQATTAAPSASGGEVIFAGALLPVVAA